MKLNVHVLGTHVAVLESVGDFKSVLTYLPEMNNADLVSLTMPVRTESYQWDDELPPFFRMNLPEGYLLQILEEEFGPHLGAKPIDLLSVIGRNMVGRVQVARPGAVLNEPAKPIEVADLLKGDNSEEAFKELVRTHARSGVSGVLPKFLDTEEKRQNELGRHQKESLVTHLHIIKGSSARIPYATANEHLCMQAAAKVVTCAKTELSQDGRVLVVHRFDIDKEGKAFLALEDFCCLLGLKPSQKYETTWERIARAVRDFVAGGDQRESFLSLTKILLLTFALRNSDCHAKNLALLYSRREDARLSPAYDMFTTVVYPGYQYRPPGIMFSGKKTWLPGKNLTRFITTQFGIPEREQKGIVEQISDALADTTPAVRELMKQLPEFRDIGKRILLAWHDGVQHLRDVKTYSMPEWKSSSAFEGISDVPKLENPRTVIGKSELLADRSKSRKK